MVTDSISDFIIRIKNGSKAAKESVLVPYSKMAVAIAEALEKEGYVKGHTKKGKKIIKAIEVVLAYEGGKPKVTDVKRISKPSKRIYRKASELRPVRNGFGRLIVSTPKGILTDSEARKAGVGGEALFEIW